MIHGCYDGKSRKIMFLKCSTNNLSEAVLGLFLDAIIEHRGLWPSRVGGDFGAENVEVCEAMTNHWGPGRNSFIAGSSTRNQRIERLWRDAFRCVCQHFYYNFNAMEETGILEVENPIHLLCLHLVFTEKINNSLQEFKEVFNNHRLSTEKGWTPNQIWITGMANEQNPLARNHVEDAVAHDNYGVDTAGSRPGNEDSNNNVTVAPVHKPNINDVACFVRLNIDINAQVDDFGIDIYLKALELAINYLSQ